MPDKAAKRIMHKDGLPTATTAGGVGEAATVRHVHVEPASSADGPLTPSENAAFMERFEKQEAVGREELVKVGRLLEAEQLARQIGVKPQAISKAVQDGRMFSLAGAAGGQLYPAFFAAPALDGAQVQQVARALGDLPGASKWQFFTTPKISLGGKTAIAALEDGEFDAVLVAAAGFLGS